jgi:hypothetical protein
LGKKQGIFLSKPTDCGNKTIPEVEKSKTQTHHQKTKWSLERALLPRPAAYKAAALLG